MASGTSPSETSLLLNTETSLLFNTSPPSDLSMASISSGERCRDSDSLIDSLFQTISRHLALRKPYLSQGNYGSSSQTNSSRTPGIFAEARGIFEQTGILAQTETPISSHGIFTHTQISSDLLLALSRSLASESQFSAQEILPCILRRLRLWRILPVEERRSPAGLKALSLDLAGLADSLELPPSRRMQIVWLPYRRSEADPSSFFTVEEGTLAGITAAEIVVVPKRRRSSSEGAPSQHEMAAFRSGCSACQMPRNANARHHPSCAKHSRDDAENIPPMRHENIHDPHTHPHPNPTSTKRGLASIPLIRIPSTVLPVAKPKPKPLQVFRRNTTTAVVHYAKSTAHAHANSTAHTHPSANTRHVNLNPQPQSVPVHRSVSVDATLCNSKSKPKPISMSGPKPALVSAPRSAVSTSSSTSSTSSSSTSHTSSNSNFVPRSSSTSSISTSVYASSSRPSRMTAPTPRPRPWPLPEINAHGLGLGPRSALRPVNVSASGHRAVNRSHDSGAAGAVAGGGAVRRKDPAVKSVGLKGFANSVGLKED